MVLAFDQGDPPLEADHFSRSPENKGMADEKKYTGYCMKCKAKDREMKNVEVVVMKRKNGEGKAAKGTCAVCSTGMYKILGKND